MDEGTDERFYDAGYYFFYGEGLTEKLKCLVQILHSPNRAEVLIAHLYPKIAVILYGISNYLFHLELSVLCGRSINVQY